MKIKTPYHKERVFTCTIKGKLAGYISFRRVGKVKSELFEMTRIEVSKEHKHKGIATKLFKDMLEEIKPRKLFLTSHRSNTEARSFYLKMGMILEALLPNHYYDGVDELVFVLHRNGR